MTANLYVVRKYTNYVVKLILPMFIIVLLSTLTYWIDPMSAPAQSGRYSDSRTVYSDIQPHSIQRPAQDQLQHAAGLVCMVGTHIFAHTTRLTL